MLNIYQRLPKHICRWMFRKIIDKKSLENFQLYEKCKFFHTSSFVLKKKDEDIQSVVKREMIFEEAKKETCNKETFQTAISTYLVREKMRRGHCEFIYAALRRMKEFNVHKDLETYKNIMDIFPKGKFIPENLFQVEFMHYPKQQQCAIDLLEQMESNGVIPDAEMHQMLLNIFGDFSHPMKKFKRMMYWMPKFKNISPFPLPNPLPDEQLELAILALKRMNPDLKNKISIFHIKPEDEFSKELENKWVASSQSPAQQSLISNHQIDKPLYVEGGFLIWLRDKNVIYFILRADPKLEHTQQNIIPDFDQEEDLDFKNWNTYFTEETAIQDPPNIHQQEESTILGLCVAEKPIKQSLVAWLKFLQQWNPQLLNIPVVFTLRSPSADLQIIEETQKSNL